MDGTPNRRALHASASKDNHLPAGAGGDARHHRRSANEMDGAMKNITHTSVRAAAAVATIVALISSVGAPWKWS
jgi:hypothetical protein